MTPTADARVERLGGHVAVAVAVVVAGIAILTSIDFNEYRGLIAEQAKALTGRDLTINGSLNLELSLNPAVAVEGGTPVAGDDDDDDDRRPRAPPPWPLRRPSVLVGPRQLW